MLLYLTVSHTDEGLRQYLTPFSYLSKKLLRVFVANQLQLEICVMGTSLEKASYDMQSRTFLEDEFVVQSGFCGSFESHATLNLVSLYIAP